MRRQKAREQAFFLLFERSFRDEEISEIIKTTLLCKDIKINGFASELAHNTAEKLEEIDAEIRRFLKGWKISRLSRVSLTAIRLAIYEIKYIDSIAVGISINEAVGLARKFAGEDDASFVNGVLGAFSRLVETSESKTPDTGETADIAEVEGDDADMSAYDPDIEDQGRQDSL